MEKRPASLVPRLGKESAGQRVGRRSNAYHTVASHGGLGGLVGWTLLEKHPSLTAGHPAAVARAVLAKRRELR
jgi:hypothetical protein